MKSKIGAAALFSALLLAGPPAGGQSIVSTGESFVDASLLIGDEGADGVRDAGLELVIRDGWKTYWRSPGEAGVPPEFDWSRSRNLAAVEVAWPAPEVFDSFGFRTLGYSGTVVLPLHLVPQDPTRPIELELDATLGVCRDICVFEETTLAARIAPGEAGPAAGRIDAAEAEVPPDGAAAGVTRASCRVSGAGADRSFTAEVEFDRPLGDPQVALEGPEDAWFQKTTAEHDGTRLAIVSTLSLVDETAWIDRSALRITVLDGDRAADIRGCSAAPG